MEIVNSTFSENSASSASASPVLVMPGTGADVDVYFLHTTFKANIGVYAIATAFKGSVTFGASLLEDNPGALCTGASSAFGSLLGNSFDSSHTSAANCGLDAAVEHDYLVTDPRLSPLASGGHSRVHRIGLGHLAIDQGSCQNTVDQLSLPRPIGGQCEPGSVEWRP
jgi:hypothetical protein